MMRNYKRFFSLAAGLFLLSVMPTWSITLEDAIRIAVESNPNIGQAVANREAIEFELRQGRGLFLPRVDLETRYGGEIRDSSTTRANNDQNHLFARREVSVVVRQLLFDGFEAASEVERQASRVDAASFRVYERSEFTALAVVREYLDIQRQLQVLAISRQNVRYHRQLLGKIGKGTKARSISVADRQQAQERLFAAKARVAENLEGVKAGHARFIRLVGRPIGKTRRSRSIAKYLPKNLDLAIGMARKYHPSLSIAKADLDAAQALIRKAEAQYYPKFSLELRASSGNNLAGVRGRDNDLQGNLVMNWNLYNGGIDVANRQEQIRRADEQRMKIHSVSREVEEAVRLSWDRRQQQLKRLRAVRQQSAAIQRLTVSYGEQFKIGGRSLLDLLDTQNTLFSTKTLAVTAATAVKFAEYRLLASTGSLLKSLNISPNPAAQDYARSQAKVPPTKPAETMSRYTPNRGEPFGPLY